VQIEHDKYYFQGGTNMQKSIYYSAKPWQLLLYPLGNGVNNLFLVLMMFTSYLAAGGYGIAVAVAGTIITATRIFDGITDPLIALVSDRVNTRFGRVRILMTIGYSIMALSVITLFFLGIGKGIIFFTVTYMIYIIGYTFYGVATSAANSILTNDPVQRPKLFRYQTIYTMILTTLLTSVYLSMVLAPKHGGLKVAALQELAQLVLIVGTVLVIIAMIAISPADKPEAFASARKGKVSLKDSLKLIKENRNLQIYIVAACSEKLTMQAGSQTAINMMLYGIIIGNYAFQGKMSLYTLIPSIFLITWATKNAGKNGSKAAVIKWSIITIIMSVLFVAFMVVVDPRQISKSFIPTTIFLILMLLRSGATTATSACTGAMIPDIIDYEMYRSGNYMPSTVAAVYSFVDKMISSLATTIVGFGLASIGYVAKMPQPGDPNTQKLFWMTMFLSQGLIIIAFSFTVFAMKWYTLDKKKVEEIQQHNHKAREASKKTAVTNKTAVEV
jgi:GPH family glycoside/pentoside/hexuronide:cation symporter